MPACGAVERQCYQVKTGLDMDAIATYVNASATACDMNTKLSVNVLV